MNSLFYLLWRSSVNFLKETLHRPALLTLYIFIVVMLCGATLAGVFAPRETPQNLYDIRLIGGMFFVLMLMSLFSSLKRAFGSGSSFFLMSDVNLLFISPVSPQKILLYGVIKFFRNAILYSVFILFQGMLFKTLFGVSFPLLLLITGIFILCLFLLELLVMLIYGATNSNPQRQIVAKIMIALVFLPFVIASAFEIYHAGNLMTALPDIFDSPSYQALPVLGWGAAAIVGFIGGKLFSGWLFMALILIAIAGLLTLLLKLKTSYYEDVLAATESAFERKRALAEGNISAAQLPTRKIPISKTEIFGFGAQALFGKHLLETFRKSRFGFFDQSTFISSVLVIIHMFVSQPDPENRIFSIMGFLCTLQLITVGIGPGRFELNLHYIYLLPAPAFSKIVWSNLSVVMKSFLDMVLVFGIAGVVLHENYLIIIGAILALTLFALFLISVNVLSLRWIGADLSHAILSAIYVFGIGIILMPGVITAYVVRNHIGGDVGTLAALGIGCFWTALAAVACFALAKGILDNCDMPVVKITK